MKNDRDKKRGPKPLLKRCGYASPHSANRWMMNRYLFIHNKEIFTIVFQLGNRVTDIIHGQVRGIFL